MSDTKKPEASAASPSNPGPPETSGKKKTFFLILMLAGMIGFAEAAGAVVYFLKFDEDRRRVVDASIGKREDDFNSTLRYRAHPYFNYTGSPEYTDVDGNLVHHPIGFRATEIDPATPAERGTVRIVALGGSTTYGFYAEDPRIIWPELTGELLNKIDDANVEVINAGLPNYTTFEMIGFAAMWLPELDADFVLLHTGFNDAFAVGFEDEGGPDNRHFRHACNYRPVPEWARTAMRASYLARAIGTGWLLRSGHGIGDLTPAIQYPIPPDDVVRDNAAKATGKYYRRNLETLITLVRRAGAEPVILNMPINPRFEETGHPYYEPVSQAVVRNNAIGAEIAENHGLLHVDLFSRMRDHDTYVDAVHVKPQGMETKALHVAQALAPHVIERTVAELAEPRSIDDGEIVALATSPARAE